MLGLLFLLAKYFIFISVIAITIVLFPKYIKFKNSKYKMSCGNIFFKTMFDKGNYGEFLTFVYLEELDSFNKLLTNVYIPKEDGTSTEIDLIMLSPTGIYVFESKNYSGWIFGSENSRYWTQSLQNKQRNKFFNPIWQNKAHITALKNIIDIDDNIFKSYIVFSERCELKKIQLDSKNVKVIKRNDLLSTINQDINNSSTVIKVNKMMEIYEMLKKYSNVDEAIKREHIKSIQRALKEE